MKIFGVDITAKYIFFELDGDRYAVLFRESISKGVYDISVWKNGKKVDAHNMRVYPPLKQVIKQLRRIHIPEWRKEMVKRYRRLHNQ